MPGQTQAFSPHAPVKGRDAFGEEGLIKDLNFLRPCRIRQQKPHTDGCNYPPLSKGTTALLFSPGDLPSPLLHILHGVPPHIEPNIGRKIIKKCPELTRFQISHQLAVNAAGLALIALTPCWELICPLWLFANSETALATLLTWSFTLTQGIFVRIFILGLVGFFFFFL